MKTLVINCSSSSLKYQLIDMESEGVVVKGLYERIEIEDSKLTHQPSGKGKFVIEKPMPTYKMVTGMVMKTLQNAGHGVIRDTSKISVIGHRVLYGGTVHSSSIVVNKDVERVIRECFDLESLYNPANLIGIEAREAVMSKTPNVAVFDTALGTSMPGEAYMYAIPHEYFEKYGIRRCGFYGTGHKFVSTEAIKFGGLDPKTAKMIACHLGSGPSVFASIGGKCVDVGMGLTPLEGLIMGARNGDVDPAMLQLIMNKEGLDISEMLNILNKRSGVYGMTNDISSDFRDIENAKAEGNHLAEVALDASIYHVTKYVGAYATVVDGVDAVAFTVGTDENDKARRKAICGSLACVGMKTNNELNNIRDEERVVSSADSKVKVMLIPTNEELATARETLDLVQ